MEQFLKPARAVSLVAVGASIFSLLCAIASANDAAAAKTKAQPAAPVSEAEQQQKDANASRQAYDAGIKSYSASKFQPAVDQLSAALRGGGLGSAEMAKALYVRGLAYKKQSKPGLAISDLTSALWLKNGLGEADQKSAMAERAEAYKLAGLGDGDSGADRVAVADPNPSPAGAVATVPPAPAAKAIAKASAAAPALAAAAPQPQPVTVAAGKPESAVMTVATPNGQVTRQSPDSEAAKDAANARRLASLPIETSGFQTAAAGSLINDTPRAPTAVTPPSVTEAAIPAPVPSTAAAPAAIAAAAPTAAATPVLAAAPGDEAIPASPIPPSTVGGFFSNLFGGSPSPAPPVTQPTPTPITTASTGPAASTATAKDKAAVPAKSVASLSPSAPPAAMPSGKYKLHIAAVRSRVEADALAQRLASQHGTALKNRVPVVDEAVIGSMGTFYRVRVGSFANAEEPRGVCNTLRSGGFDCLVVTN